MRILASIVGLASVAVAGEPVKTDTHRAFQPVVRPALPPACGDARATVDRFILAALEPKGIAPNPEADRPTLIRRVALDLTGLPPTVAEIDAFLADQSPIAYERMVERYLASPHYGERWGKFWLDAAGYADSNGYFSADSDRPLAWRYRDYVVRSFNADKPYDRFVQEQLAGDELDEPTPESVIATGYYRLGLWDDEPADKEQARYDVLDGIVSTTSQVVLGMTVGCARCHDHKKDPVRQRDYYQLLAFFQDVTDMNGRNTRFLATDEQRREQERLIRAKQAREAELYQQ